jgi:alanyl-tRNA synthetase
MTDLLVSYPAGSTVESSVVAAVTRMDGQVLFAVAQTPCHPLSPRWPDQPADRCTLRREGDPATGEASAGKTARADGDAMSGIDTPLRCYEGYLLNGELNVGEPDGDAGAEAIPCVVHGAPAELALSVGEQVGLRVDEPYRAALSLSHSRCHLVSLALNAALKDAWRKDPGARDSLGNPDFDKLAIDSSSIDERGSLDCYRVGKHLRKTGFLAGALDDTEALAHVVRDVVQGWLLSSPEVSVTPGRCALDERRTWSCALPEGTASFPCGGTHPSRLRPDADLRVSISWDPAERRLAMRADGGYFHV